ncbi:MAG: hypothetical protein V4692_15880 [Bdellovibrionota bacterium]
MILIKKFKEAPKPLQNQILLWLVGILLAGGVALFFDAGDSEKTEPTAIDRESASTFIPAGFVLVPIEIANFQSLDSILGQHGVVDLFKPSSEPDGRPIRVASKIKILRAPLNPSHFAVLAPEEESAALVSYQGAFTVVVQNPKESSGTRFVNTDGNRVRPGHRKPRAVSRITVEVRGGIEN